MFSKRPLIVLLGVIVATAVLSIFDPLPRHVRTDTASLAGRAEKFRVKFIPICITKVNKVSKIREGNTEAQVQSACNCIAQDFYPLIKDQDNIDVAELEKQPGMEKRILAIVTKCANQTGLSMAE